MDRWPLDHLNPLDEAPGKNRASNCTCFVTISHWSFQIGTEHMFSFSPPLQICPNDSQALLSTVSSQLPWPRSISDSSVTWSVVIRFGAQKFPAVLPSSQYVAGSR